MGYPGTALKTYRPTEAQLYFDWNISAFVKNVLTAMQFISSSRRTCDRVQRRVVVCRSVVACYVTKSGDVSSQLRSAMSNQKRLSDHMSTFPCAPPVL